MKILGTLLLGCVLVGDAGFPGCGGAPRPTKEFSGETKPAPEDDAKESEKPAAEEQPADPSGE